MMRLTLALSTLFLLTACPVPVDNGGDGQNELAPNLPPPDCDRDGFDIDFETATAAIGRRGGKRYIRYDVQGTGGVFDKLSVIGYLREGEDTLPAGEKIRVFSEDGLMNCETCVIAYRGCDGESCSETYLADGELEIISSGVEGDTFKAKLLWDRGQTVFKELDGDGEVHARGYEFCGSNLVFEAPITNDRRGNCSEDGDGQTVGDRLGDWVLPNCYGDMVGIHDECGRTKAKVIMLTTGWCPACTTRVPAMEQEILPMGADKAQAVFVLGEMGHGEAPTYQACMGYAQGKGLDPARLLIDNGARNGNNVSFLQTVWGDPPSQERTHGNLDICPDGEGRWGLPYVAVLDGENNRYVWGSGSCASPYGSHTQAVQALIAGQ